ncbi:branched-chain alpha-keto acid dehydrogenase subunit E2 [candidate division KSB1 bacterium]|nr:branched-chain alpha-keto acid dehydrogenase subunit E2 [candidate division KSB1 bacterium]
MSKEIKLPEIAENVDSAEVIHILVSTGDHVNIDDPLMELESEKATFEVPSPQEGNIIEILVSEGDTVQVGQTIVKMESEKAEEKETSKKKKEETEEEEKEKEEKAEEAEPKTKKEETAEPEEEEIPEEPETPAEDTEQKEERVEKETAPPKDKIAPAAPSVRRLARELGVDINRIEGSGPGGRISHEDVKNFVKEKKGGGIETTELPDFSQWGDTEMEDMVVTRRRIAESMSHSWRTVPQVTQFDEADITDVEQYRKKQAAKIEKAGGKLTITSILVKIVSLALKKFPRFNASLDMDKKQIIFKKYYHIGIAVDTERGLLVPVIKDADKKNIVELSVEITELAQKTRNKKISPDELQGGNFAISNLGGIGGTAFTPIVYPPQVAVLGVARGAFKPIYKEDELQKRLILPLSLTYDHRIIDGADGARFLRWICRALEHPFSVILEGGF